MWNIFCFCSNGLILSRIFWLRILDLSTVWKSKSTWYLQFSRRYISFLNYWNIKFRFNKIRKYIFSIFVKDSSTSKILTMVTLVRLITALGYLWSRLRQLICFFQHSINLFKPIFSRTVSVEIKKNESRK